MIEAESQTVLNNLTKHDFQDAFKNDRSTGNGAYARKGVTLRVMVASRPKVTFSPDYSTSPRLNGILSFYNSRTAGEHPLCVQWRKVFLRHFHML
jgi:hypothetical protein